MKISCIPLLLLAGLWGCSEEIPREKGTGPVRQPPAQNPSGAALHKGQTGSQSPKLTKRDDMAINARVQLTAIATGGKWEEFPAHYSSLPEGTDFDYLRTKACQAWIEHDPQGWLAWASAHPDRCVLQSLEHDLTGDSTLEIAIKAFTPYLEKNAGDPLGRDILSVFTKKSEAAPETVAKAVAKMEPSPLRDRLVQGAAEGFSGKGDWDNVRKSFDAIADKAIITQTGSRISGDLARSDTDIPDALSVIRKFSDDDVTMSLFYRSFITRMTVADPAHTVEWVQKRTDPGDVDFWLQSVIPTLAFRDEAAAVSLLEKVSAPDLKATLREQVAQAAELNRRKVPKQP